MLELAVLDDDENAARVALADARAAATEQWMFETTAKTLKAIVDCRGPSWIAEIARELRGNDD